MRTKSLISIGIMFALIVALNGVNVFGQGIMLRATSAASEGMAGVAIANPIDSAGAMYQNPASIAGFCKSEMSFGMGVLMAKSEVSSNVVGIGEGKTKSSTGSLPSPSMSAIWKIPHSRMTLGFAMGGVGGAAALYEQDPTNFVMSQSVRTSNVQILQMMPTVAYNLTPKLALGITPVVSMGKLEIGPSGIASHGGVHATNVGTRYIWGAGINLGLYLDTHNNFKYGLTFKSPQWCEDIMVYDSQGHAHAFDLNLPMILGAGVSYCGFERTIIGIDFRYFDYGNTVGFEDGGYDANEKFIGLGWKSIMAIAIGAQYQLNDAIKLRIGYCYNENPIRSENQMYNIPSPLSMKHSVHCGTSVMFAKDWEFSLAYTHAFKHGGTGPFTYFNYHGTVTNKAGADTILAGLTKRF